MTKLRKGIRYAYPTSDRAAELGVPHSGGYYVAQSVLREDGTWSPAYIADGCGCEAFKCQDDAALLALLAEADGMLYAGL